VAAHAAVVAGVADVGSVAGARWCFRGVSEIRVSKRRLENGQSSRTQVRLFGILDGIPLFDFENGSQALIRTFMRSERPWNSKRKRR